jgi:hypothetical protein
MRRSRREWLKRATVAGAAVALAGTRTASAASKSEGVARVRGDVRINGATAKFGMSLKPGDIVTTGRRGELVVAVGSDAYLVRADARVQFESAGGTALIDSLRIFTGALLAVFRPGDRKEIRTATALIGIRGTGIYVEAQANRTYACTCYGEAELVPLADPQQAETVRTRRHDQPRYIYPKGMPRMIEAAPVVDHTDAELVLLESLVGRKPPFPPYGSGY